jgi:quinol monooxygenase YgiN
MDVSVVVAFACAVFAAAGTGVLVGRCIRAPRMDIIAWAGTLAALAVALGAQALGARNGFGSPTFRVVQIGTQLVAPLWLTWGLAELAGKSVAVRFGVKLVTAALTVVGAVVLITDPLSDTPFSKSWPAASAHYQIIPRSLLSLIAGLTLAAVVVTLIVALVRLRSDPAWRRPLIAIAAAGVAVIALLGLRLSLPANMGYPALCAVCAALTWFAGIQADKTRLAELHEEVPSGPARRPGRAVPAPLDEPADDEVFGASYPRQAENGGYRRYGDDDWYRLDRGNQSNGGYGYPPNGGSRQNGGYGMNGLHQEDREHRPGGGYQPEKDYQRDDAAGGLPDRTGGTGGLPERSGGLPSGPDRLPDRTAGLPGAAGGLSSAAGEFAGGSGGLSGADRTGVWQPRNAGRDTSMAASDSVSTGPGPAVGGPTPAVSVTSEQTATQRLYGLIAIYTLAEGREAEFDALAEQVVDEVRVSEPDALVYAVHSVPNAPMQRIFYEVYRDRMAYEEHKRHPYIQRFDVDRSPYVLATNVIELGTQQAKLSPLPGLSRLFGHAAGE